MKTCTAVVFLSLLSLGRSAPQTSCDSLVKPITISNEEMLGKWLYFGGSSDIPGSRSLAHLMTSVWLDITATSQSNVLNLVQTQKIVDECSSFTYNVTFENSTMLIEKPFYLKEVYLPTDCSDCLSVYEEIISGTDTFKSLLLFSKSNNVSSAAVEMLKTQAVCLKMPSPIMTETEEEICPVNLAPSEGLSALNELLEAKMGHRLARFLDTIFDLFVN
ncbi:uncharacterized protein [Labrus bergylta]|uniref:uncharacterized protein n=1 Tax=Labrus bergylta TaxID=56723 RepID=UPI0009B4E874|nr:uncharacterized protein LOC109992782 [Labrus bergylta]